MTAPLERGPAAIFLNLAAASGRSTRTLRAVELTRTALGADLHTADTRDPGELVAWLEASIGGYGTVVIAGGDGSLSIAYNVAADRPGITLGYLPAGFGNASAHLLHLPRDPVALAAVISRGDARPVDLVDAGGRLALFAGAGWDALVTERYAAAGARRLVGWAGAITRSVPDLVRRRLVAVSSVDGAELYRGLIELLVISTTPWYGRGLLVNPGARPDSGVLTMRVYPGPLPSFAVEVARWLTRRHPSVQATAGTEFVLRAVDGEPLIVQADGDAIGRRAEWRFKIRPRAVRLIGQWSTGGAKSHH